jgi:flagellar biogenesis protein FliO
MRKAIATAAIICMLALLCAPHPGFAQEVGRETQAAEPTSQPPEDLGAGYLPYDEPEALGTGGFFGAIVRTIFSLAFVLALLYATLWAIRRFTGGAAGPSTGGATRVVGRIYLSPKVVVYFLRLPEKLLVIGTNAGGISLLTAIDDEDAINQIENDLRGANAGVSAPRFSRLFDKSLSKFQKTVDGEDSGFDDQLSALNDQIGRLKGLARRRSGDEE